MLRNPETSFTLLALLVALGGAPSLLGLRWAVPALAQSTPSEFPLPASVPADTSVNIDGSASMTLINESLKARFEERYPGTQVDLAAGGTDAALQALLAGELDLVAVGRDLTQAERDQGLVEVPLSREKIAIIVGADNPFAGDLTFEQFAQIFRGEITDWSQVGGAPGPIRFVDRPDFSDTRRSLSNYAVFQQAPFATGSNAEQVATDDTAAVVQALGADGISYAIANQVLNRDGVKIVPMHQTLPTDPRYPFSQPRGYVYRGTPTPPVQAFLGFATSAPGQEVVADALEEEAAAVAPAAPADSPAPPAASPGPVLEAAPAAPIPAPSSNQPEGWLPWLALLLLGALPFLLGLLRRREAVAPVVPPLRPVPAVVPPRQVPASRIVLTPRNSEDVYAYWEAPESHKADLKRQGGRDLKLRIYDVTDIDLDRQPAHSVQEYDVAETDQDRHVPIMASDRDYLAEIGYVTSDGRWLKLARSNSVRVPASAAVEAAPAPIAPPPVVPPVVPPAVAPAAPPSIVSEAPVSEAPLMPAPTPAPAEPTVEAAEPETPAMPPAAAAALGTGATLAMGAAAMAALAKENDQSAVEAAKFDVGQTDLSAERLADVDENLPDLPDGYGESRIVLMPRDPQWAYTYWDVPDQHKALLRSQGGQRLALRLYDVTDIDANSQRPHSVQQYDCDELARDWYLTIPVSDRDYLVEIGYLTSEGLWLVLARSNAVRIPPIYPSDWFEDQFITLGWDEDRRGKTFLRLIPPGRRVADTGNPIYDEIFDMAESAEAMRLAGSLYGSMQQVPASVRGSHQMESGAALSSMQASGAAISSYVHSESGSALSSMQASGAALSSFAFLPEVGIWSGRTESGVGMYTESGIGRYTESGVGVYTQSGVGMSGMGIYTQSGVGMSGVGVYTQSGVGMSGVGIYTQSGVGMSGMGIYTQSGVGMSGVGIYTQSGVGMSGVGMSGVGMSGVGIYTQSGVGMSGVGMYTMSGMGMSGVGMGYPGPTSYARMSGVGMYTDSGAGLYTMSRAGIYSQSGVGLPNFSGIGMSGIGFFGSMPPIRARKFWLLADAELIIYGATEPDALVTIAGRPVKLNPDGTFRFQMSFQDGMLDFPILAVAADGVQTRAVHMRFNRETPERRTNTKDEATDQPY
jgi:ABC-type phosphate transport system substrate-binding protein